MQLVVSSQLWAIMGMVEYLRVCLSAFVERKIAWVPRRCNKMAQWAASVGVSGCSSFSVILKHIRSYDMYCGF